MPTFTNILADIFGFKFDPDGGALPKWKERPKPKADLPTPAPKNEGNAVPVQISEHYTDDELNAIEQMDEHLFARNRNKYGFHKTPADFVADYRKKQQRNNTEHSIDFNAEMFNINGLTPRDYGELLAYVPPLCNGTPESLTMAAAVKMELVKTGFKKHAAILDKLKTAFPELTIQKIKHYSSAFKKAMKN